MHAPNRVYWFTSAVVTLVAAIVGSIQLDAHRKTHVAIIDYEKSVPRPQSQSVSVGRFLSQWIDDDSPEVVSSTTYASASIDLNADRSPETIVWMSGRYWCGTSGCPVLVLQRANESYRIIAEIRVALPPIRVLATKHHGWRDLSVLIEGGGIRRGYEGLLPFDGERYASDPFQPPAVRLLAQQQGVTVIARSPKSM